jgi:predicted secreted acid phosphatase
MTFKNLFRLIKMHFFTRILLFTVLSIQFTSVYCAEPANLGLLKTQLRQYHASGLYAHELQKKIQTAQHYIEQQAAANQKNKHHERLALILDIDETSLSNYKHIIEDDFAANPKHIQKNIMKADGAVIQPMLALYQEAHKLGIHVFFVTGRRVFQQKATEKNLIQAGYTHWDGLYLRPNNYNLQSIIPFKSQTRATIERKGYTIIATIGDQYSDLRGGHAKKGFKLPNPFYYLP